MPSEIKLLYMMILKFDVISIFSVVENFGLRIKNKNVPE